MINLKYKVNENCIGCGACEATCPSVFKLQDDGFAKAIDDEVKQEDLAPAKEAMEGCPVSAIEQVD